MATHREIKKGGGFTQVSNRVIQDESLSPKAKGILIENASFVMICINLHSPLQRTLDDGVDINPFVHGRAPFFTALR